VADGPIVRMGSHRGGNVYFSINAHHQSSVESSRVQSCQAVKVSCFTALCILTPLYSEGFLPSDSVACLTVSRRRCVENAFLPGGSGLSNMERGL